MARDHLRLDVTLVARQKYGDVAYECGDIAYLEIRRASVTTSSRDDLTRGFDPSRRRIATERISRHESDLRLKPARANDSDLWTLYYQRPSELLHGVIVSDRAPLGRRHSLRFHATRLATALADER